MNMIDFENLTADQQIAIRQFENTGHVAIRGCRQSGKTEALRQISGNVPKSSRVLVVGVMDRVRREFDLPWQVDIMSFPDFKKAHADPHSQIWKYDVIIMDGGILYPHSEFKMACATNDNESLGTFDTPLKEIHFEKALNTKVVSVKVTS